jgi:hypothetical protein
MIALNTKTALLFDHEKREVRFVEYDDTLESLYDFVSCDMVDTIRFDREHIIFVDDEGLFKNYDCGFHIQYKGKQIEFVGSGLLVGDMCGSTAPLTLIPSDLKVEIVVYGKEEEESV